MWSLSVKVPNCGETAGSLCGNVYRVTHNAWLAESAPWLIARPFKLLVIIFGALITRWLAHRAIHRVVRGTTKSSVPMVLKPLAEHIPASIQEATGLINERRRQRAQTLGSVLRNLASISILAVATLMVLQLLTLNLGPLLASAGIVGLAVGFGAQHLVKDVIAGVFMLLEDQYGVGDSVDLGVASGVVEEVGLRTTTVRDVCGVVWYIRNGEIARVGNKSQGWAMVVVDIPIGLKISVEDAGPALARTAAAFAEEPEWATELLEPPAVLGVEQITAEGPVIRVTVKTQSEAQWRVARELRTRLAATLHANESSENRSGPPTPRQAGKSLPITPRNTIDTD